MNWTRAQREQARTLAGYERHRAVKAAAAQVDPQAALITYRHQLRAVAPAWIASRIMLRLGVTEEEMAFVAPVLQHVEALVYRGDFESEHNQAEGLQDCDPTWRSAVEQILRSAGLADPLVLAELDELQDCFSRETRIMIERKPVDDDTMRELCYRRSSHFRLLLRAWHLALGRRYDEDFFRVARHACARFEVAQDLHTYAQDVQDDTFNVLRLEVWRHGTDEARAHVDELHRHIVTDMHREIAVARRRTLLAVVPAFLQKSPGRFLWLLPVPLLRSYAHRRLNATAYAGESQNPVLVPEKDAAEPKLPGPEIIR